MDTKDSQNRRNVERNTIRQFRW